MVAGADGPICDYDASGIGRALRGSMSHPSIMTGSTRHSLRRAVSRARTGSALGWEGAVEGAEREQLGDVADRLRETADQCDACYGLAADCLDAIDHETDDAEAWALVREAISHLQDARGLERDGGDAADAELAIEALQAAAAEVRS